MKINHKALSDLAATYENHTRQLRVSTPVQLELSNWCFENDRNMSVTIATALLEFLHNRGHAWADREIAEIMGDAEVAA